MIHKLKVLDNFLGKDIVDALIETLYNQVSDFPDTHKRFLEAVESLREIHGPDAKHDIDRYVAAIEQKCSAMVFFAGVQGLKMNHDHFVNPMAPTCVWAQVDFDDFLRVELAYAMPLYNSASRYIRAISLQIPDEISEPVTGYETSMEVYGMKLAHYYGYLMGNDLLAHCVPGYHPDIALTLQYRHMLEEYFGGRLSMAQWEGVIPTALWKIAPILECDPQDVLVYREELLRKTVI